MCWKLSSFIIKIAKKLFEYCVGTDENDKSKLDVNDVAYSNSTNYHRFSVYFSILFMVKVLQQLSYGDEVHIQLQERELGSLRDQFRYQGHP